MHTKASSTWCHQSRSFQLEQSISVLRSQSHVPWALTAKRVVNFIYSCDQCLRQEANKYRKGQMQTPPKKKKNLEVFLNCRGNCVGQVLHGDFHIFVTFSWLSAHQILPALVGRPFANAFCVFVFFSARCSCSEGCAVSTDGHGACLRAPLFRFLPDTLRGGNRHGTTNRS